MINIKIRWNKEYAEVTISNEISTIQTHLLDEEERFALINVLHNAIWELYLSKPD